MAVLGDYALGVQAALNMDGKLPFDYAGVEASEALDKVAASLEELEKGAPVHKVSKRKLKRLKQIVAEQENWREYIEQNKRMRQWVLDAENILDGSWAEVPEQNEANAQNAEEKRVTNREVGIRFDAFIQEWSQILVEGNDVSTK